MCEIDLNSFLSAIFGGLFTLAGVLLASYLQRKADSTNEFKILKKARENFFAELESNRSWLEYIQVDLETQFEAILNDIFRFHPVSSYSRSFFDIERPVLSKILWDNQLAVQIVTGIYNNMENCSDFLVHYEDTHYKRDTFFEIEFLNVRN